MEIKTRKQLEKRIDQLTEAYEIDIHKKMVDAVNDYIKHNGGIDPPSSIDVFCDTVALSGAWAYDRIQNKTCTTHHKDYRGSKTKKIRKALGFPF